MRYVDPDGRSDCGIYDGEGNYSDTLVKDTIESATQQKLNDIINNFNNGRDEANHIDKETLRTLFFDADKAKELLMEREDLHKDLRYQLNEVSPDKEQNAKETNMVKLPWWKSIFHNPLKNNKYVSKDGHLEGVYNKKSGDSDENPNFMATFNFFDPNTQPTEHKKTDVDPYAKWGN